MDKSDLILMLAIIIFGIGVFQLGIYTATLLGGLPIL